MDEGWPLGLQTLNMRVGHIRNLQVSSSLSFSTILTASSSRTSVASSDFETECRSSFSQRNTLGRLIGMTSILNLSNRSFRGSRRTVDPLKCKKSHTSKTWFSLCTKRCDDGERACSTPSLGHFLQMERRASNDNGSGRLATGSNVPHSEGDEFQSLVGGGRRSSGDLSVDKGFGYPFTCIDGTCKRFFG